MHDKKPAADERVTQYLRQNTSVDATTIRRFAEKVEVDGDCWKWTAKSSGTGGAEYAQFWIASRHVQAHRWSWVIVNGPVPEGLVLDHHLFPQDGCIGPLCVHPDHVRPTTSRDNILRGNGACARNARKTACPKGHPYDRVTKAGHRVCSTCRAASARERYLRRLGGHLPVAVLTDPESTEE